VHAGAASGTARWLDDSGRFRRHHHVVRHDPAGYDRIARLVTGRAHGLVLGGGGARGFAHLGALRAFEEARIPIDIIGGTSMGAIIGGQYVMGYTLDRMIDLNRRSFVHTNPISDYTIPLVSLIAGDRMSRTLKKMYGDARIEDQRLPYFCVATNLSRATVAVHQQGAMSFAVGTSIAVPGLAPPLIQNGDFLVDGGLLDNVPVAVMRRVAQGRVFTVDVSKRVEFTTTRKPYAALSGWRVLRERLGRVTRRATVPSMYQLLWRATVLNSVHRSEEVRRMSDVYVNPGLDDVEIFDWKEFDRAIEAGYRATVEALSNGVNLANVASAGGAADVAGAVSQCDPAASALLLDDSRSLAVSKSPVPSNCHAIGSETMLRSPRSAIC
jgi:NTE family protein